MKNVGKIADASSAGRPGPGTGNGVPPENFAQEIAALFRAGRVDMIAQKARLAIRDWPDNPIGWKTLGNLLLMQGKHDDAIEPLSVAMERAPSDPQVHQSLATACLQLRRLGEAEGHYRQAIALKPDYVQAHINLGITLFELGRFEEAASCHRHALALNPEMVEGHNNLGNTLKELGRFSDAEASYRRALALRPDLPETWSNLGLVLQRQQRHDEASGAYGKALTGKPDFVPAHLGLAETYISLHRTNDAVGCYRRALAIDPCNIEALEGLNGALGRMVPLWHLAMMNDAQRNDAYLAALRRAVTPDVHVLEIGTGSGLLSMMAARLGARHVTTCEAVPAIAETARSIVADNGLSSQVTVLSHISTNLEVGVHLDDRADLLVSEILSSEFLSEGVLPSIEDAKRRLLKPGATIIPARGAIRFALVGGIELEMNVRVDQVCGFDLSRFNRIAAGKQFVGRNDLAMEFLSDDETAFPFDFESTERFPAGEEMLIDVPIRRGGRCCGIIQWIRLEMDNDGNLFENHPATRNPASGWQHCIYAFPETIEVRPGQVAVILAVHNRNTPWFFFRGLKEG